MKMKNKIFLMAAASSVVLFGSSCTKNFQSINTDPNAIPLSGVHFSSLFTNAQLTTSGNSDGNAYEDWRANLIYAGCMIQHISSTTGYWDGDKYFFNASYMSSYWDQNYGPQASGANPLLNGNSSPIQNIVEVVTHTKTDTAQQNLYNMARIFKAFMFQRMTDMYGDIPYSQAGQGYLSGITAPVYDKQQAIYTDLLNELSDAASKLNLTSKNTLLGADLVYGGDASKWKKFAYSEMVRVAMRLSKVDPANAQKWVAAAAAGGVFTGNADNAILIHQAAAPNGAGSQVANGSGSVLAVIDPSSAHLSKAFVDYLNATHDPRLSYFGTVVANPGVASDLGDNTAANQLGQPNGFDLSGGPTDISHASNWPGNQNKYSVVNRNTYSRTDAPTFFLTYAETEFLLAEAAQRGWVTGTSATAYYTNGVMGAMDQMGQVAKVGAAPAAGLVTAFLAANPLTPGSELQIINSQYWVASFLDETEAWANWRRSAFPVLTPVNYPGNSTNGTIPRRYVYSTVEAAANAANYEAAVSGLTDGDKMTSRIWWDK
jgi:hypothetical protein